MTKLLHGIQSCWLDFIQMNVCTIVRCTDEINGMFYINTNKTIDLNVDLISRFHFVAINSFGGSCKYNWTSIHRSTSATFLGANFNISLFIRKNKFTFTIANYSSVKELFTCGKSLIIRAYKLSKPIFCFRT